MRRPVHVLGYGDLGREVVRQLTDEGRTVVVLQRHSPDQLPEGATFLKADVLQRDELCAALASADKVVSTIGFPYKGSVWSYSWPSAMRNLIHACELATAKLVIAENLYVYGPRTEVLHEDLPLVAVGRKPRARVHAAHVWQEAAVAGRLEVAAVRAPDFYGPGVQNSGMGPPSLGALAGGRAATFFGSAEYLHDVAHISDFARAMILVLDGSGKNFGQAWHAPCAPTRSLRELVTLAAAALGVRPRIREMPLWLMRGLAPFVPIVRESVELHFTFDRPYLVSSEKFQRAFGIGPIPLEVGIPEAAISYRLQSLAHRESGGTSLVSPTRLSVEAGIKKSQ